MNEESPEVSGALEELHQYLADLLPPLVVADSIQILIHHPAEITASAIYTWTLSHLRLDRSRSATDYMYHGVMKLHLMGEYKLIPQETLTPFLTRVKQILLEYSPAEEREQFQLNLERIGNARTETSSHLEILFRPTTSQKVQDHAEPVKDAEIKRFQHLMQRLEKRLAALGPDNSTAGQEEVVAQALAEAARSASETVELNEMLEHLKKLGIQAGSDDLFRVLGRSLPGWYLPNRPDVVLPEDSNLQAMHRIIAKAPDPQQASERFHQLIRSAVERFNEDSLIQAVSMIELAQKIIDAKEVTPVMVEIARSKNHENVDVEKLRKYAEAPAHHPLLRKFLNFFNALSPQGLLESLRQEKKRDRRKILLLLLECHGESTRALAMESLVTMPVHLDRDEMYFRRNLIHLLRRIPPSAEESPKRVVEVILPYVELNWPPMILKEALAFLAQSKQEGVERNLVRLLHEIETMLQHSQKKTAPYTENLTLLDRVVAALCRVGTSSARREVIDHAFRKRPELGDSLARLSELGNYDLSDDFSTLDRLMTSLKANLPLRRLGIVFSQRDEKCKRIVEALSGTPVAHVRSALQDLAQQYPDLQTGQAAAKVKVATDPLPTPIVKVPTDLSAVSSAKVATDVLSTTVKRPAETGSVSLMGDLDLFGLPSLIQNLSDSALTGTLTLKGPDDEVFAILIFNQGNLQFCRNGILTAESAFYQLFEKPRKGTFEFSKNIQAGVHPESDLPGVLPMMLEAMRRYDELQNSRGVVPDDLRLKAKETRPLPLPEEKDGLLFRNLWNAVQRGTTPLECETIIEADAYRIRRLLAHWMELGIIESA